MHTGVDKLLALSQLLQYDMAQSFARDGLTESRAHLLWVLRDGPSTQRELAEALRVTPRNITGLVDGLVEDGRVIRRAHPTDRRATHVDLTAAGRELVNGMVEGYAEMHDVLFGELSPAELARFERTLDVVIERLAKRLEEEWQ